LPEENIGSYKGKASVKK